ncbi:MAG: T9SS type A sorting domain-containing protein [Bacteroidetes bacterium]|nr:T9SS type A sorting domain-containing protein [Bacteroidota bacterium]
MKKIYLIILIAIIQTISCFGKQADICDSLWSISPNPFASYTNITIYDLDVDTVSLKVYNMWGDLVYEYFLDSISGTITLTFNNNSLPDGQYLAYLITNNDTCIKKLKKDITASLPDTYSKAELNLVIKPIPAKDYINISVNKEITGHIQITDINGKIVYADKLVDQKNKKRKE